MIALPNSFSILPADSAIPPGPITDAAAEALASLLWAVAEQELREEARAEQNDNSSGGQDQ